MTPHYSSATGDGFRSAAAGARRVSTRVMAVLRDTSPPQSAASCARFPIFRASHRSSQLPQTDRQPDSLPLPRTILFSRGIPSP
jgi:hypothetical protein